MITKYKQEINQPYSLHDMIVNKIYRINNDVCLEFENGFEDIKEPFNQVDGKVVIKDVDQDFSCALLLSNMGQYGEFKGEKLSLDVFLEKYEGCSFEIVDEMFGYNQVEYSGYLSFPDNDLLIQTALSFYFTGDIVYETNE